MVQLCVNLIRLTWQPMRNSICAAQLPVLLGLVQLASSGLQDTRIQCDPSSPRVVNLQEHDFGAVTNLGSPAAVPDGGCIVQLNSPKDIQISVQDVDLHTNCTGYYLEISDALNSMKFCSSSSDFVPTDLLMGKNVTIRLHIDADTKLSRRVQGFKLIFSSALPTYVCGDNLQITNVTTGFITSPDYPNGRNFQNCQISVLSKNRPILLQNVLYIYVKTTDSCAHLPTNRTVQLVIEDNGTVVDTVTERPLPVNWTYTSSSAQLYMSLSGSCRDFNKFLFKFLFHVIPRPPVNYSTTVTPMTPSSDVGGVVGGVVGGLLLILIVATATILFLRCKKRHDSKSPADHTASNSLRAQQGSVHDYDYISAEFGRKQSVANTNESAQLYTSHLDENEVAAVYQSEMIENELYTESKRISTEENVYLSPSADPRDQSLYSGLYEASEHS